MKQYLVVGETQTGHRFETTVWASNEHNAKEIVLSKVTGIADDGKRYGCYARATEVK